MNDGDDRSGFLLSYMIHMMIHFVELRTDHPSNHLSTNRIFFTGLRTPVRRRRRGYGIVITHHIIFDGLAV